MVVNKLRLTFYVIFIFMLGVLSYEGYAIVQSFNLATSYPCPPERIMLPVNPDNHNDGLVLMYDEQTRQVYNMTVVDKCRTK